MERDMKMKLDIENFEKRLELKRLMKRRKERIKKERRKRAIEIVIILALIIFQIVVFIKMQYNPTEQERTASFDIAREYAKTRYINEVIE